MDPKRSLAGTPKPRMPMLDRCNAIKHVDCESGETSYSDGFPSSLSLDGDGVERRSHSLDLYSHFPSSSTILFSSQTSFRVDGHGGDFDQLCRSLGLSGPDDFAIPASVWEARKLRADSLSASSSSTKLATDPSTWSPMPGKELLEEVETRAGRRDEDDNPGKKLPPSAGSNRIHRSIKSVRPPPEIATPFVSGSTLAHLPSPTVVAVSPPPSIVERRETENEIEPRNFAFSPPSPPAIAREDVISYLAPPPSSLNPTPDVQHPSQEDDAKSTMTNTTAPEDEDEDSPLGREIPDISEEGSSIDLNESEDKVTELRVGETVRELQDSSSRQIDRNLSMPVITISPNASFRRTISSWIKGGLLGSGSFGTVYEAISDDGFFFAVKEVSLLDQGSNAKQCIAQLEQEIALLSRFEHENIVQYFGTDKEETKLYIFLELVTQGSLASLYQKYHLRDSQVSAYTRQILNGLDYLHDRDVVHRDIKCANILVDARGSVKLADFGLAKQTSKLNMLKSCKGSIYWMAPEVAKAKPYGASADIWSLGCTVLEMLTRRVPYPDLEWTQALFRIGRGERPPIPSSLSKDARDFIHQCVQVNPNDRPSAAQLLKHPFVTRSLSGSLGSGQALRE